MTASTLLRCDYCTETSEFREEETPSEAGWLEVLKYDMMSEEVKSLDFCSDECISSYFA